MCTKYRHRVCVYVALSRVVCVWTWYFGRHAVVVMDSLTVVALRKAGWMEAQHSGHRARSTSSSPCPAPSTRWVMSVLLMRPNPFLLQMTHRVQCQSCTCLHTPLGVCFSVSLFSPEFSLNFVPSYTTCSALLLCPLIGSTRSLGASTDKESLFPNSWPWTPAVTPPH